MKTWGTDPELMLKDGNNYISAIEVVPASPQHRLTIKGHEFYFDNVMAEFALKPASSKSQAIEYLRECLELYAEVVSPFRLITQSHAIFPDNIWDEKDPQGESLAAVAGCALDRCAYLVKDMEAPKEIIQNSTHRSAGGHIHIGDDLLNREHGLWQAPSIVMMDLLIGVPSLFLDKDVTSPWRRDIYGQAGRYRICDYGLEYRTPGNFWLSSPKLASLMYDLSEFACDLVTDDARISEHCEAEFSKYASKKPAQAYKYKTFDSKKLKKVINKSNKKKSGRDFYDLALSLLPNGLAKDVNDCLQLEKLDLYKEWDL